jgi:hypothetical protein
METKRYLVVYEIVKNCMVMEYKEKYFSSLKEAYNFKNNKINPKLFKIEYIILS